MNENGSGIGKKKGSERALVGQGGSGRAVFIKVLNHCLRVAQLDKLSSLVGGLMQKTTLENFAGMQVIDVQGSKRLV